MPDAPALVGVGRDRAAQAIAARFSRLMNASTSPFGVLVSMKVRLHSFGQKWQTVSSSFFVLYSSSIAARRPMNVDRPLRRTTRSVSNAAPSAPASPVCGCTNTSAPGTRSLM